MKPGLTVASVVVCGALILSLGTGVRLSFGLFVEPMSHGLGWNIGVLSLALALQNLLWGLLQPIAGAIADRYGTTRTLIGGAALYVAGVLIMATAASPLQFHLGAGLLIGMGVAATGFPVVLSAVARVTPPARRTAYLGLTTAGGSFGQFSIAPLSQMLINHSGWFSALFILAALCAVMAPLAIPLRGRAVSATPDTNAPLSLPLTLRQAAEHPSYWLLNGGFFVCGFHVAFISVHLPGYLASCNMPPALGAAALSIIGLFNIVGTFSAGYLGNRFALRKLLSLIYFSRAVVIALFLLVPVSETSVMLFAAGMGFLWLGTVPLTSGIVAQVFGPRYVATLFGIVLMSHQIGAFVGAWWGGILFDQSGSYDGIWWASIALGVVAALIHLPISERPLKPA